MSELMKMLTSGALALALALGLMPGFGAIGGTSEAVADEHLMVAQANDNDTVTIKGTECYDKAHEVLELVNAERKKAGLRALKLDTRLTQGAMQRAAELSLHYKHERPNGSNDFEVIPDDMQGMMGANIAMGYTTAEGVMQGWFYEEQKLYQNGESDFQKVGHYLNIVNAGYSCIGIGVFCKDGIYYWAQLFSSSTNATEGVRKGTVDASHRVDVNYKACGSKQSFNEGFDFDEKPTLTIGETFEMNYCLLKSATLGPDYCVIEPESATWTSSNPGICSVNPKGVVTGQSFGTATITATLPSGRSLTHEWTVSEPAQSMYRLYNPNSGEHFYTGSTVERDALKDVGWNYEGVGWVAPLKSNTPVYRLYSGTDHHYCTSEVERNSLLDAGWKDEGIGWYSDDEHRVSLYRQFNPNVDPGAPSNNSGSHNYTTSRDEHSSLVANGWRDEGVGWHAIK